MMRPPCVRSAGSFSWSFSRMAEHALIAWESQAADDCLVRITAQLAFHHSPRDFKRILGRAVITFWQLQHTEQPGPPSLWLGIGLINTIMVTTFHTWASSAQDLKADEEACPVSRSKTAMATNTCSSVVQQMLPSPFLNPGREVYGCLTFLGDTSTQLKGQKGAFGEALRKNSVATNMGGRRFASGKRWVCRRREKGQGRTHRLQS